MSEQKKAKRAPAKRAGRKEAKSGKRRKASAMVERVLKQIESRIEAADLKPTVGDYLRLLQFREEIQEEEHEAREIRVTWVEPGSEQEPKK